MAHESTIQFYHGTGTPPPPPLIIAEPAHEHLIILFIRQPILPLSMVFDRCSENLLAVLIPVFFAPNQS